MMQPQRVVIVGGGFGGLYAARAFGNNPNVEVTLIDKRNFHLFQPLLYQVATGGLSSGDIAYPLRSVLRRQRNTRVIQSTVTDIDPDGKRVLLAGDDGAVAYDTLIVATGVRHHYFGNDQWEPIAPGLKTLEDAIEMRRRIFTAFEESEKTSDPDERAAWMTFVIAGAGPTGVELAGALGELANSTMCDEFRTFNPGNARFLLVDGSNRVLPPYPPDLSDRACKDLAGLGVTVWPDTLVSNIEGDVVTFKNTKDDSTSHIRAKTVLWAAGMQASALGQVIHERTGAERDRAGRVHVAPDLSVPGYPDLFVIGDLAHFAHQGDKPLPGVAQVAMQQGHYMAKLVKARQHGKDVAPFRYKDRGSMAVIGRNAAVVDAGRLHFTGYLAWLIWIFIHVAYLIGFERRLTVLIQWAWSYFTYRRSGRLILEPRNAADRQEASEYERLAA